MDRRFWQSRVMAAPVLKAAGAPQASPIAAASGCPAIPDEVDCRTAATYMETQHWKLHDRVRSAPRIAWCHSSAGSRISWSASASCCRAAPRPRRSSRRSRPQAATPIRSITTSNIAAPAACRICSRTASRPWSTPRPAPACFRSWSRNSLVGFLEQSSRFLKPVYADDTIYPALEVTELAPGRTTGVVTLRSTVHNQRKELVLEGMQKFLIRKRPT